MDVVEEQENSKSYAHAAGRMAAGEMGMDHWEDGGCR